jgi:hypothetical protein
MFVGVVSEAARSEAGSPVRYGTILSVESTDNRDATETDEQSNVDVFLSPYVEVVTDSGMTSWDFRYEPSLRYRSEPGDNQNDTELHHYLTLKLRHELGARSRVRLSNNFMQIEDPQIEEGGAIQRADRSYTLNTLRGALNYDLGRLSNIDIGMISQIRSYDDEAIATLSDKNELGGVIAYRRVMTELVNLLGHVAYTMYAYEDDGLRSRDFDMIRGSLGLEFTFNPQLSGSVSGGAQSRSYDSDALDDESNGYVEALLSGTLNPDLIIGLDGSVGVRDADVYPYPSQEYAEIRGFFDWDMTMAFALRGAMTYRMSTYDAYAALALPGGDEETLVVDVTLQYKVSELASFTLGHRVEDITADDSLLSGSYTRNTSRAGMQLHF